MAKSQPAPPAIEPAAQPPEQQIAELIRTLYGEAPAVVRVEFLAGRPLEIRRRVHSKDYTYVLWDGVRYTFTPNQAAAVKTLWEEAAHGTPEVRLITLYADAGSSRDRDHALAELFRLGDEKHPAVGTMIVAGEQKGSVRLAD